MKKRTSIAFISAFSLALLLLSLPFEKNVAIRNAISEKLIFFSKKKGNVPENPDICTWLQENKVEEYEAKEFAIKLAPSSSFIIGKVVFRPQTAESRALWIDVGASDNPESGKKIIAKNSPVLSGDALVGVIDYVGKKASLVRLISDSALHPSVRVARNVPDKMQFYSIQTVDELKELLQDAAEQKALSFLLEKLKCELQIPKTPLFLAKGSLQGIDGSSAPLLKGIGFTYDFKDEHGPARDLRTGTPIDPLGEYGAIEAAPIVEVGDLLVTSGMDGLFPEGLKIAHVAHIKPLEEGAYTYELLAKPIAHDLLDLTYVTILPPQDFDKSEIPSRIEKVVKQLDAES